MVENFPSNYLPDQFKKDDDSSSIGQQKQEVNKILAPGSGEILDYNGIPSSTTICECNSSPIEDLRYFKQKRFDIRQKILGFEVTDDLKENRCRDPDPEKHLKNLLPTFTPDDNFEAS